MAAPVYRRPDIYIEEVDRVERPIVGVETSVFGALGISQKGPVNQAVETTSIDEVKRIFGDPIDGEALYYALAGFFAEGGTKAYVVRLAHMTDPDTGALAAATASISADGVGVAGPARFVGSLDVTLLALVAGWHLDIDVDNTGTKVATVDAVAAIDTGSGGTFTGADGTTTADYITNADGIIRSVDLSGVADGVANYIDALNAQMIGVSVDVDTGQIEVTTDRKGSSASIQWLNFGANFAALTGLTAATIPSAGPNNVANVEAVTFAELKALIEEAVKTAVAGDLLVATQDALGYLVLTSQTTGASSEIDLVAASSAAFVIAAGLSGLGTQGGGSEVAGSAASAAPSLTIKAGWRSYESPGLDGNSLSVAVLFDPLFTSAGAGSDLQLDAGAGATQLQMTSVKGILPFSYLRLVEGATSEYVEVLDVSNAVVSGAIVQLVNLKTALVGSFTAAAAAIDSMEHTFEIYRDGVLVREHRQLSMNPDSRVYAVSTLNDKASGSENVVVTDLALAFPANILGVTALTDLTGGTSEVTSFANTDVLGSDVGKTGFYALDEASDMTLLAVPPSLVQLGKTTIGANRTVQMAALIYAEGRMDCFTILDLPWGLTRDAAKAYRNDVLGADTRWGGMWGPNVEVSDPLGTGTAPTVMVPPSGHISGLHARVDAIAPTEGGGVSAAAAGLGAFGRLRSVVGLERFFSSRDHDVLNPEGINLIRLFKRKGPSGVIPGFLVMGARTLSSDVRWRYVPVRRFMTFAEQSIRIGTMWAIFRPNNRKLWQKLTANIETFLRARWRAGQLFGANEAEAFFVRIDDKLNTPEEIDNGRLIAEIGMATVKPAEFIIYRVEQLQSGSSSVSEAA